MCLLTCVFTYNCMCLCLFSPGQPQSITVSVQPANNFPLDIYLLIDQSLSMNDDLQNLKNLSSQLGRFNFILKCKP